MKVLILGSGGREACFAWKIASESCVEKVIVAPGNAGMTLNQHGDKISLLNETDHFALVEYAKSEKIDLTFVGPEAPLVKGIVDLFRKNELTIVGPDQYCANLEGSKIFAKEFMKEFSIPTARFVVAASYDEAIENIENWSFSNHGHVVKADGLAGGKGVVVAKTKEEAKSALYDFMVNSDVSIKTKDVLLEEVLTGREVSYFALCDGENFKYMGMACDHKRLLDNDEGPNTGGMGCFHSKSWPNDEVKEKIENKILRPTLLGMKKRGHPYTGILFIGLMVDEKQDPYVVEYNVRFGDPETQTLLPLMKGSLVSALQASACGRLDKANDVELDESLESIHIVATSGGYPSIDQTPLSLGHKISAEDISSENVHLFYAGVKEQGGHLVNSGGRVLGITVTSESLDDAHAKAYQAISEVSFSRMHYRRDIGKKVL